MIGRNDILTLKIYNRNITFLGRFLSWFLGRFRGRFLGRFRGRFLSRFRGRFLGRFFGRIKWVFKAWNHKTKTMGIYARSTCFVMS